MEGCCERLLPKTLESCCQSERQSDRRWISGLSQYNAVSCIHYLSKTYQHNIDPAFILREGKKYPNSMGNKSVALKDPNSCSIYHFKQFKEIIYFNQQQQYGVRMLRKDFFRNLQKTHFKILQHNCQSELKVKSH